MTRANRPTGFTLLELMTTVAIVGLLASVALPAYQRLTVRSRTTERDVMSNAIKRAVSALYFRDGKVNETGTLNPTDLPGTSKLAFERRPVGDGWNKIASMVELEGAVYYQYQFVAAEAGVGSAAFFDLTVQGDLDGDGTPSARWRHYERREGQYWTDESDTTDTWCLTESGAACVDDTRTF